MGLEERSPVRRGRRLAGMAVALVVGLGALAPAMAGAQPAGPQSVADLAEGLTDAVVNISTSQTVKAPQGIPLPDLPEGSPFRDFFEDFFDRQQKDDNRPRRVQSLGSGFVIDASGLIVTNNHVIQDADEITANFNDGTKLTAEIVGRDTKTDLAVLRVQPQKPLVALKFGDSDHLRVGDWVMAIGNPFGLGGTVTLGIVSARNRDINSGPYDDFIQTDAAINRGNSGGPLFNMKGEVVGINTAIISPSGGSIGIGFAIPSAIAFNVIEQLKQYGETRRGWLGVRIQQVTDEIAESLGMDEARGALVAGVTPTGPAETGGIQPGDVVIRFDGRDVPEMRDLPRMVADTQIGKEVDVVVLRKGEEVAIKVALGRLEEGEKIDQTTEEPETQQPDVPATAEVLGMTLSAMSADLRQTYKLADSIKGVVITEVGPDSAAAEKRIEPGNVIVEVAQEAVSSPADVADKVAALKEAGRKSALLLLSSGQGELRFVAVQIGE